jgi:hypothetical protein
MRPSRFRLNTSHPLAQGLVFAGLGQHPGGGTLYDSSGYRHDGTLTNMDPATDWMWISSLGRGAFDCDVSETAHVLTPITIVDYPITLAIWARRSSNENNKHLYMQGTGDGGKLLSVHTRTNGLRCDFNYSGGDGPYFLFEYSPDTEWHHIALVILDTALAPILYYDGQLIVPSDNEFSRSATGDTLQIGAATNSSWLGELADPMLWNRAIMSAEARVLSDPSNVLLDGLIQPYTPFYYTLSQETLTKIFKIGKLLLAG